jgi:CHAD domain-containing protein
MMRTGRTRTSGRHKLSSAAGLDCATAFQRIALDCVAGITARHSSACAGDAEAVHQIRVAITRLRAAVLFFAPIAVDAEWPGRRKEIVWLHASLGAARDSDVMMEYANRGRYRAWSRRMIGEHLDQRRTRDHRRLVRCLRSVRFQNLIEGLSDWAKHGPWLARWERAARGKALEPLKTYSEAELNRWRRRLIRNGRHLKTLGASRRHRLRIRAKRLRYMLEALMDTVAVRDRGKFRNLQRSARGLQRALGDLRDLKRFSDLAALSSPTGDGKRGKNRPPGYRRQKEKLLSAAVEAYRGLKRTGA